LFCSLFLNARSLIGDCSQVQIVRFLVALSGAEIIL